MNSQAWKYLERKVARDIGGERILQKGMSVPDVKKGNLLIECKNRKSTSIINDIKKLIKYRSNAKAILALIHRVSGKKKIDVYMLYSDLKKLVRESLQTEDFKIQLSYSDFIEMAGKVKRE